MMNEVSEMNNVSINKGYYGWTAESEVELGGNRLIRFTTMKRSSGKLITSAQSLQDNGRGALTFIMFQDFNKCVLSSDPKRVTEKVVLEQHNKALELQNDIVTEAKSFYGITS